MKWPVAGVLLALAGGGSACGDSSGPAVPLALAILAGNNQSGAPGDTLPQPLAVVLTGSDSHLYPGATVTWAVTAGPATVAPTSSITDAQGRASTTVALGVQIAPVVITATVAGIPPVTFNAAVVGACGSAVAYTFGTTVNAALEVTDCKSNGFYLDLFAVTIPSAPAVTFTSTSSTFDNYLELFTPASRLVAFNDDAASGDTLHASFKLIAAPGNYIIAPTSFDTVVTGAYALSSAITAGTVAGCEPVFVTLGVSFGENVQAGDCATTGTNIWFSDQVAIILDSGSVIRIREASGTFNTFLTFFDAFSSYFSYNDDSAPGFTNSYLVDTAPATSLYVIDISTLDTMVVGPYTLTIAASTTATTLQTLKLIPMSPAIRSKQQSRLADVRARTGRRGRKPT
jgi:hypothetical protein